MSMGTRAVFDPDGAAPAQVSAAVSPEHSVSGNTFKLPKKSRDELRTILTRAGGEIGVENFIDQMEVLCRDVYRVTYLDVRTGAQQVSDYDAKLQEITAALTRAAEVIEWLRAQDSRLLFLDPGSVFPLPFDPSREHSPEDFELAKLPPHQRHAAVKQREKLVWLMSDEGLTAINLALKGIASNAMRGRSNLPKGKAKGTKQVKPLGRLIGMLGVHLSERLVASPAAGPRELHKNKLLLDVCFTLVAALENDRRLREFGITRKQVRDSLLSAQKVLFKVS